MLGNGTDTEGPCGRTQRHAEISSHDTAANRHPEIPRPRSQYPKRRVSERQPKPLPAYLDADEVNALIRAASNARARPLFLVQYSAAAMVQCSPALDTLALEVRDLSLDCRRSA